MQSVAQMTYSSIFILDLSGQDIIVLLKGKRSRVGTCIQL